MHPSAPEGLIIIWVDNAPIKAYLEYSKDES